MARIATQVAVYARISPVTRQEHAPFRPMDFIVLRL